MSHSWLMESSDLVDKLPNMCAWVALVGSLGMSRLHVCEDSIVALFGSNTVILVVVRLELMMGMELKKIVLSSLRKCHVAAVSATIGVPRGVR